MGRQFKVDVTLRKTRYQREPIAAVLTVHLIAKGDCVGRMVVRQLCATQFGSTYTRWFGYSCRGTASNFLIARI